MYPPPTDLRAKVQGLDLLLTWTAPEGVQGAKFLIDRDGRLYGATSEVSWVDEDAPKGRHTYEVFTSSEDAVGERSATGAAITVRVGEPSLAEARLEGAFTTRVALVSATDGWAGMDPRWKGYWTFRPRCGHGSCSTDLEVPTEGGTLEVLLRPSGRLYVGATDSSQSVCPSGGQQARLEVEVRVTRASSGGGEWGADGFEGDVTLTFPGSGPCSGESWRAKASGGVLLATDLESDG